MSPHIPSSHYDDRTRVNRWEKDDEDVDDERLQSVQWDGVTTCHWQDVDNPVSVELKCHFCVEWGWIFSAQFIRDSWCGVGACFGCIYVRIKKNCLLFVPQMFKLTSSPSSNLQAKSRWIRRCEIYQEVHHTPQDLIWFLFSLLASSSIHHPTQQWPN